MYNLTNWPSLVINVNYFSLVFDEDNKLTVDAAGKCVKLKTISNVAWPAPKNEVPIKKKMVGIMPTIKFKPLRIV